MIIESVSLGDLFVETHIDSTRVHAQGYVHGGGGGGGGGSWRVLLINKQNANSAVTVAGAFSAQVVDEQTFERPPRTEALVRGQIILGPFATAIVSVSKHFGR